MAGFDGGRRRRGSRIAMPAALRYALAVSRRTPVVCSMRRSGHPSRPRARIWCFRSSPKMLAVPAGNHTAPRRVNVLGRCYLTGRFSAVHDWPVLGVHRGGSTRAIVTTSFSISATCGSSSTIRTRPIGAGINARSLPILRQASGVVTVGESPTECRGNLDSTHAPRCQPADPRARAGRRSGLSPDPRRTVSGHPLA